MFRSWGLCLKWGGGGWGGDGGRVGGNIRWSLNRLTDEVEGGLWVCGGGFSLSFRPDVELKSHLTSFTAGSQDLNGSSVTNVSNQCC